MSVGSAAVHERPVMLGPNPVHRFYEGGALWRAFRGLEQRDSGWAEDWVASCIRAGETERDEGLSPLLEHPGVLLADIVRANPSALLGDEAVRSPHGPPVQVKLVSPRDRVPLHIHPDDAFARAHHGSHCGKAEAWVLLGAPGTGREGAFCGVGLRDGVTQSAFAAAVAAQDHEALIGSLHRVELRAGDVVFIPPGMPHYISGGTLFAEVQQPADVGYLIEWEGFVADAGEASGGLGMALALEAMDYTTTSREVAVSRTFQNRRTILDGEGATEVELLGVEAQAYFEARELSVMADHAPEPGRYHVVIVTDGDGWIEGAFGREAIRRGQTFVIGAHLVHRYWAGRAPLRLLRFFGPSRQDRVAGQPIPR